MMTYALTNLTLLDAGLTIPSAVVVVEAGRIAFAGPLEDAPDLHGLPVFDAAGRGWMAAPGLIDLQVNGAYGDDFSVRPDSISKVACRLPETGVVAFLPTFVTSPLESYAGFLAATQAARQSESGARVLGAHIEGPFLNPDSRGAHDAALFREPGPDALAFYHPLAAAALVTLAAELPHGLEAVRWLRSQGLAVSLGHTRATYAEANAAFEAGVTYLTHLFNAMPPLSHREPGPIGALFDSPDVRCGLIVDGIHVDPAVVRLVYKLLGPGRITLVTDAMAAMGNPPGEYPLAGQTVYVDGRSARLADGRLAGSILRLDEAVRNMVEYCRCTPAEAVQMATATPAAVLGLEDRFGHLRPDYPADLVILDRDLQVVATLIRGEPVFLAPQLSKETSDRFKPLFA